jgi:rhamnosyltransferase subunit B
VRPVLIAWELGENLGHAMPLARIAAILRAEGAAIVVAARSLLNARIAFRGIDVSLLQAPVWPSYHHVPVLTGAGNYVNLLTNVGFHKEENLAAVVAGWVNLLDMVKPGAVVADHCPALLVATRIRNVPVIHVGVPMMMPPLDGANLPMVDALVSAVTDERKLMASAAKVLALWRKPAPDNLPRLLATPFRFVFGLPDIDPYLASRREPLYEPPEGLPTFVVPPAERALFVYHGAEHAEAEPLFQAISSTGIRTTCYLRGNTGTISRFLEKRGIEVLSEPPSISDTLPRYSHVLSGGGAYMTQAAMAAGRPHLMLPRHEEAATNSRMATRLNVGRWINAWGDRDALRADIERAVGDHAMTLEAIRLASAITIRPLRPAMDLVKAAVMRNLS